VKALDTPALLALLEGRKEAEWILGEIAGGEVCTTEVNLFELEAAVLADRRADRTRRLAVLERLRRRISVLPLDDRASRAAARIIAGGKGATTATAALVLGSVSAGGATELLTTEAGRFQGASSAVPIRLLRSKPRKSAVSRKS
jgi:predicted nucleic acid-binding protein